MQSPHLSQELIRRCKACMVHKATLQHYMSNTLRIQHIPSFCRPSKNSVASARPITFLHCTGCTTLSVSSQNTHRPKTSILRCKGCCKKSKRTIFLTAAAGRSPASSASKAMAKLGSVGCFRARSAFRMEGTNGSSAGKAALRAGALLLSLLRACRHSVTQFTCAVRSCA